MYVFWSQFSFQPTHRDLYDQTVKSIVSISSLYLFLFYFNSQTDLSSVTFVTKNFSLLPFYQLSVYITNLKVNMLNRYCL